MFLLIAFIVFPIVLFAIVQHKNNAIRKAKREIKDEDEFYEELQAIKSNHNAYIISFVVFEILIVAFCIIVLII